MKRSCRVFLLGTLLAASASAGVNLVVSGGALRDAQGAPLAAGSMAVLVASTQDNVFQTPTPTSPLQVGTAFGDDVIIGVFPVSGSQTATNGGFVGIVPIDYAAMGIPGFAAGKQLTLYWFPAASLTGNQIAANADYGAYRTDVQINRSNTTWLAPDDATGGTLELNFLTQAIGGESDNALALAAYNVSTTTVAITVQTSPAGRSISVDGTSYVSPQTFNWPPGSSHTIATTAVQDGTTGVQYTFANWSDAGTISHTVAPTAVATYTASFTAQYLLTMSADGSGTVSPPSGWYDAGQSVPISATPSGGSTFFGWSGSGTGSYTGANNPSTVTMNGPVSETATFSGAGGDIAFVTGMTLGPIRNDYSGWVGMQIVVGATPLSVSQLGRLMAPGNTGTHTVKLVKASDGTDVPGGAVSIAMSGGTPGQFRYGTLSSPVTLSAGTAYWILSQEAVNGDTWYDYYTTLTTTSVATNNAVAWGTGLGDWHTYPVNNQSYVPVNFKYVTAAPTGTGFVTGMTLGPIRNDYSGWVGMQVVIGAAPLSVSQLGRLMAPGNNGTHTVKLVKASDGTDVPGSAVSIAMSGGTPGQFRYGTLSSPVTLAAGTAYWILSQETANGDTWYDYYTTLTTTSVATNNAVAWGTGLGDWHTYPVNNQSYVPVDFRYTPAAVTGTSFVTGVTPGPIRNDYSGWVGMQVVIGATPLSVSQLGRFMAPGNSGTHTVKLVKASDGTDVPGGGASIAMSGGTPGQFRYGTLSSPVTLSAGTAYWILSQETAGGDTWYDYYTTLTTTGVATNNAVAWGTGLGDWHTYPVSNQSYVPVDFKYTPAAVTSTAYVTGVTLGPIRNDYTGWVGMQIVVGANPLSVSQLGRLMAPGNSGAHTVKLVKASDGTDVPGGAISIAMSGGTPGQFRYGTLSSPVTLAAGTAYWILSLEAANGDTWYDYYTTLTTTSVATDNAVAWGTGPGDWHTYPVSNQSFVPVDFKY